MKDPNQIETINPVTGRLSVETINPDPSLTQQQFKDECDINNIMKKYQTTGEFLHVTSKIGKYADLTSITDYQTMLNKTIYAKEAFMSLPATTRLRFQNDPSQLISFLNDKANHDEGVKLGLITPPPPVDPLPKTTTP